MCAYAQAINEYREGPNVDRSLWTEIVDRRWKWKCPHHPYPLQLNKSPNKFWCCCNKQVQRIKKVFVWCDKQILTSSQNFWTSENHNMDWEAECSLWGDPKWVILKHTTTTNQWGSHIGKTHICFRIGKQSLLYYYAFPLELFSIKCIHQS